MILRNIMGQDRSLRFVTQSAVSRLASAVRILYNTVSRTALTDQQYLSAQSWSRCTITPPSPFTTHPMRLNDSHHGRDHSVCHCSNLRPESIETVETNQSYVQHGDQVGRLFYHRLPEVSGDCQASQGSSSSTPRATAETVGPLKPLPLDRQGQSSSNKVLPNP